MHRKEDTFSIKVNIATMSKGADSFWIIIPKILIIRKFLDIISLKSIVRRNKHDDTEKRISEETDCVS